MLWGRDDSHTGRVENINQQKPIPLSSVGFDNPEAKEAAIERYYLNEIDRQAEIAALNINSAVMAGCRTRNPHDPLVWSALQSMMFSTICILRLLDPRSVYDAYPGMSKSASLRHAKARGKRLRELLEIGDDSFILKVDAVRNAFEHYDEHIDSRFVGGAYSLTDWYITDGHAFKTPPKFGAQPAGAVGMRVFFPAGGMLYFDDEELDLFELELDLLEIRRLIPLKLEELSAQFKGMRALFGGHHAVVLMSAEHVQYRFNEWQRLRSEALQAAPQMELVAIPAPGE